MKLILSTLCLVLCLSLATSYSNSWGRRNSEDYILMREQVIRMPKRNDYWTLNIQYPKPGQNSYRTISAINVIDRFTNGSGAFPTLLTGGPGWKHASLNLRSQNGRGINSTVEMWGR